MKTLLSSAAIVLAIAATTICAKAECLSVVGLNIGCSPLVDDVPRRKQPQQSHETALHPVPVHREVAKRPKPQQADEKAPAVSPPPALPGAVTQESPVDGLRAGSPSQQGEEKAPAVSPPPALPPAVTQKSPVDGLRAGGP